jgi:heme/copper-type cytochrome/quinol oxidase subunit 2
VIDWNAIIWFVIWAAVVFASIALIVWIVFATIAARHIRRVNDEFYPRRRR